MAYSLKDIAHEWYDVILREKEQSYHKVVLLYIFELSR